MASSGVEDGSTLLSSSIGMLLFSIKEKKAPMLLDGRNITSVPFFTFFSLNEELHYEENINRTILREARG